MQAQNPFIKFSNHSKDNFHWDQERSRPKKPHPLHKVLLLAALGLLIGAIFAALLGCGSDNNAKPTADAKKERPKVAPTEGNPLIVEMAPADKFSGPKLTEEQLEAIKARAAQRNTDPRLIELLPPTKPGEGGLTLEQFEAIGAAAQRSTDPRLMEVLPPKKLGERGLTLEQLDAIRETAQRTTDPRLMEVGPPKKPGERGPTQEQLEAMWAAQKQLDSPFDEVLPGMTQDHLEEILQESQEEINQGEPQVFPEHH